MKQRLSTAGILLVLAIPCAPAHGQPAAPVRPGAVATVVVSSPAPLERASARFRVQPVPGVRVLGAVTGERAADARGIVRVPVTLSVPAHARAGPLVLGAVVLEWPGGWSERLDLEVQVEAVHAFALSVTPAEPVVPPGGSVRVGYRLENRGNATDTVHIEPDAGPPWTASPGQDPRVVAPGAVVVGTFEVRAPRGIPLGEQRLIRVRARHPGGVQSGSAVLLVAEPAGDLGLAQIPVSVFLGGSSAGGANLAVSGGGAIDPNTELGIDLRRIASPQGQPYGQTALWGPRMQLRLRHKDLRATLGDITLHGEGLYRGTLRAGSGIELRRQGKGLSAGVTLARPRLGLPGASEGHLLQAELGHSLAGGLLSARLLDLDPGRPDLFAAGRLQVASLQYRLESSGPHRVLAEVGLLRQGGEGAMQGASIDALYSFSTPGLSLSAGLRRIPDPAAGAALPGNEASVAGRVAVVSGLQLSGSAYEGEQPGHRTRGAGAGLQWRSGRGSVGVSWNRRQRGESSSAGGGEQRESLAASLATGLGPASLSASAEAGVVTQGDGAARGVSRLRGQLRWARPDEALWLGVHYTDEALAGSPLRGELGIRTRLGRVRLDAALGARVHNGRPAAGGLHVGTEIHLSRTLSLVVGAEYGSWISGGSPWTVSFGIRHAASLPLPLPETPPVRGIVYEDRNGNGRKDAGEPGVPGVGVSLGPLQVKSDREGRFSSRQTVPAGVPVQLDLGSLGEALLAIRSEFPLPASGGIEIPVVRAASLSLSLFEDRDGNGIQDDAEAPLAEGVVVLTDAAGRTYPRLITARGIVAFTAIPPGRYELVVRRDGKTVASARIGLAPGEHATREIGVAAQVRGIRMWNGTSGPQRP